MTGQNPDSPLNRLLLSLAGSVPPSEELKRAWQDYMGTPLPARKPDPRDVALNDLLGKILFYSRDLQNSDATDALDNWRYWCGLQASPPKK